LIQAKEGSDPSEALEDESSERERNKREKEKRLVVSNS
jgi:hypothetical protein